MENEKTSFSYFWETIIVPITNEFFEKFTDSEIKRYDISVNNSDEFKRKLKKSYNSIKEDAESRYQWVGDIKYGDRYKVASCICSALIQNKIVCYELDLVGSDIEKFDSAEKKKILQSLLKVNYTIAFRVSLAILFVFMSENYADDKEIIEKLEAQKVLLLPELKELECDHEDYIVRVLLINNIAGNLFDVLMYSNILIWIEKYNKQLS